MRWATNKQFKSDSARVAFLVCVGFGVEVQCGGLVIACFTLNWALCFRRINGRV
ncbi:DUF3265 domain-containing protein [Vibrio parahaemolyticus]|uniref:DUF3265 domain-containing protein n=1 Tax=Vibrio parahaemolyticus TaxID=670 RepID=A0A7Z2RM09_VIBPH|nr:DUF3265 domain-containing protein [Vibrio parahaemolyticus]EJG0874844.1 DUF3265 domain-containing protein [Vibrio parahaemolyticus O3]EJG0904158.1 DUF3265 domain-containing protein [Vibrio parahaemolyticus O3:K56]EJG1077003.1 DUF3265 domain-containing protein [Vibrio parahaemolyticus O1:K56]EGQ8277424.1 DUF3265 domain-containing protein [Vibrio parahaemolyticus]EGQ8941656.1 DUF3265 domain-containing protein [Vibrio parahaemolyticus]